MRFAENTSTVQGILKDATGSAQESGTVDMTKYEHATVRIRTGVVATGADDMAVTLKQSTDSSKTSEKALGFDFMYVSTAASSVPTKTAVTSDTFDVTGADSAKLWEIEIDAEELDVVNSFDHLHVELTSPGANSVLLGLEIIASQPRTAGKSSVG